MKLKTPFVASMGALLLVGALFLSLFLSTAPYRPEGKEIVLPSETAKAPQAEQIAGRNLEIVGAVEITAGNIQRVIASLSRADSYTATVTSRLYYGELSGVLTSRQSVKNGAYRVDHLSDTGVVEFTELLWEGVCYAWRGGADAYYKGAQGDFSTDQGAMLPTYETVCELPAEQITSGTFSQEGGELLLLVDTQEGDSTATYKISVQTGLLRAASFSQGGKLARSIEVEVSTEAPLDSMFVLPGETVPVYGAEEEN